MEAEAKLSKLGKRLHREVTAERRHKEVDALLQVRDVLPLSQVQLDQTKQASIVSLAISYLRLRDMMDSAGTNYGALKSLSMEEQLRFHGFVIVLDSQLRVLYATENMTDQLGPYLPDVVGHPFADLLHVDDREALQQTLDTMLSYWQADSGTQHMFVARMKTNLSPTVRSQAKVQYKTVSVTCRLKASGNRAGPNSTTVVLLCRTEDKIGFPEIVMGAYVDFVVYNHHFTRVDPKGQWLLGYHAKDIVGQDAMLFKHPNDTPPPFLRKFAEPLIAAKLKQDGFIRFPKGRFMTGWGEWVWHYTEVTASSTTHIGTGKGTSMGDMNARVYLLGPDDGTPHSPAWRFSGASFPEVGAIVNRIVSGASESDVDDLVSSFLRQMNVTRSELPQGFICSHDDSKEELSTSFEDQRLRVLQHFQRLGCTRSDLLSKTCSLVPTSSTSGESSGYQSDVSSPPSSRESVLSPPDHEQLKADPFLLGSQEESVSSSCASDSQDTVFDGQYFIPHHLLTRHDSVEDALRSVLESQTVLQ